MKTAAAYIRVSTDDQIEYSPESQIREIEKYAAAHDLILNRSYIFIDEGISGRNAKKRDAFNNMIGTAKEKPRPFDTILVWKYSRFARNQEESIVYKSLLRKQLGIDVISISEPLIEGPFGSLIERIIEWMDEYYSIRLSGEVSRGMSEKARRGEVQTSTPFGYRNKENVWEIDEKEAEIVKYIFEAYNSGATLYKIAKEATLAGARTKHGNPIYPERVRYMLRNATYTGTLIWNDIAIPDAVPQIIEHELYEIVNQKLNAARDRKGEKPAEVKRHYLTGILKCADCGLGMYYHSAKSGFQCHGYKGHKCFSHFVKAEKVEEIILTALKSMLAAAPAEYAKNTKKVSLSGDSAAIAAEIQKYAAMLKKAKLAYLEGIDTMEEYSHTKATLTAQIDELEQKAAEMDNPVKDAAVLHDKIRSLVDVLNDSNASINEKYTACRSCISRIEYKKPDETVEIQFYI